MVMLCRNHNASVRLLEERMSTERRDVNEELGIDSMSERVLSEQSIASTYAFSLELIQNEQGAAAWLRSRVTWLRMCALMVALAVIGAAVFLLTRRVDMVLYPTLRLLAECGAQLVLGVLILCAVLRPAYKPPISAHFIWIMAALALLLPSLAWLLPMAHEAHPASLEGAGDDRVPRAFACSLFGSAMSLPILVLVAGLDREGQLSRVGVIFAAFGASLFGLFCLQLHCPITHQIHLFFGHATVVYGLVGLYFLFRLVRKRI
jgi:hypothetical protein